MIALPEWNTNSISINDKNEERQEDEAIARLLQSIRVDKNTHFTFRIEEERMRIRAALRLMYHALRHQGRIEPHQSKLHLPDYITTPSLATQTALLTCTAANDANEEGTMIAAGALIRDIRPQLASLLSEEIHIDPQNSTELSDPYTSVAMRGFGSKLFINFMAFSAQAAKRQGAHHLYLTAHSDHADTYQNLYAFEDVTRSGGDMAEPKREEPVVLRGDLRNLEQNHPNAHQRLFGKPFPEDQLRWKPIPPEVASDLEAIRNVQYAQYCYSINSHPVPNPSKTAPRLRPSADDWGVS